MQADSLPAAPQGKPKNTGVGSLSLLQRIFPMQELNWGLLYRRWNLYQLSYQGSPLMDGCHLSACLHDLFFVHVLREGKQAVCLLIRTLIQLQYSYSHSQIALVVKNLPASSEDIRDAGSIPGWGRSLEGQHGSPLQYSCLESLMDRRAWKVMIHTVTKSQT